MLAFGKYTSCCLNIVFLFTIWAATISHPSPDTLVILMRGIFKDTDETLMLICAFGSLLPCSCVVSSVIILAHPERWIVWNKLASANYTENKPKNIEWRCEGENKAQMTSVWAKNWVPQVMGWRSMSVERPSVWTGLQCLWSLQCLWRVYMKPSQFLGTWDIHI